MTFGAVTAGLRASVLGDPGSEVQRRVTEKLAARYGARDVLLTDSGTTALRLAILAAMGGSKGPVALPGYGCYDLATAAIGAGAHVALYDLDPWTLGPDLSSLGATMAATRPKAVVVAHLFGCAVDVDAVQAVSSGAVVIEDAAQGAGGRLGGRPLGGIGSLSVLSFGRGKGMTGGGGGALLARDDRGLVLIGRARREVGAASTRGVGNMIAMAGQLVLGRPSLYGIPASLPFLHLGETVYQEPRVPGRAPTASMAMLERLMDPSDLEAGTRERNATRLARSVTRSRLVEPIRVLPGSEPGYLRLPVLLRKTEETARAAAWRRHGVTFMYPQTLKSLPALGPHLIDRGAALPGSSTLVERLLTLPTHGLLSEGDLRTLEAWLSES
ncbi:MAG: DegT/DnrJ/EryC1/StrS family aminotransferase [Dehalococcoidia bacterium]